MKTIKFTALSIVGIALLSTGSIHAIESLHGSGSQYVNQNNYVSNNIYDVENLAYYGDWDSDRVFVIDVDNMTLVTTVEGTGDGPYGIDQQGTDKAYALTRKTESLTVVNNFTIKNTGLIPLQHKPRSTNYNAETGLSAVSGGDKPMTSIIRVDHDEVINVIGYDELTAPEDFGGSLATGHPLWLDDSRFFMLDRAGRMIQLWNSDGDLLSTLLTPTSVHHLFQPPEDSMDANEKNIFYTTAEGNQTDSISPSIIRFEVRGSQLVKTGEVALSSYNPELDPSIMGAHHADFHPDGVHIYIGSTEGHMFVVNKDTMIVETMIDTGPGSGHTTFAPMHNLAIVTNHNATYMTVINTEDHTWVKNIEVAQSASLLYKSQAHTSGISLDMKYFYSAASHDGVFFEIDLDTLEVSRTLELDGGNANVLMGSFIWNGDGVNM
ncbi:MAG: hypothetical protein QNL62_20840 [Gammaproteobacteria bacterium]|nr:hypothetical protein [Gammaproteobacteria bacterium]